MTLAFVLTMPGNNSWNGKWSGDGSLYVVLKNYKTQKAQLRAAKMIAVGNHGYNFGDGWYANVEVRAVDAAEAKSLRKRSKGFCGYQWMIDSIERHGKILNSLQEAELREAAKVPT